jgi:hypothetical protein
VRVDAAAIRIPFSKLQLAWRAVGVLMGAGLAAVVTIADGQSLEVKAIGPLACVFFAWVALTYLGWLVSRKPAVLVTPEWIVNRSSLGALGPYSFGPVAIMWQDIALLMRYQDRWHHYIALVPYNLQEMVGRQAPVTRLHLWLNRCYSPLPIKIWMSVLPVTTDELWRELQQYAKQHVPHLAEDLFQEGEGDSSGSRQADEHEAELASPAAKAPGAAGVEQPASEGTTPGRKPSVVTVTTAGKILPLALPMLGAVLLVHAVAPAFELVGYFTTLAIACVLLLAIGVVASQSFDRLLWLALVFETGSLGFAVVHRWFEGAIMTFVALCAAYLIAATVVQFKVSRVLRRLNEEREADLRELQHRRGH